MRAVVEGCGLLLFAAAAFWFALWLSARAGRRAVTGARETYRVYLAEADAGDWRLDPAGRYEASFVLAPPFDREAE